MSPPWRVDEARRITGLHPLLDGPGVGCEVLLTDVGAAPEVPAQLRARLQPLWQRLGLGDGSVHLRPHARGWSLTLRAPEDRLHAAVDVLEAALGPDPVDEAALARALAEEASPDLLALLDDAAELPVFFDEDGLTAGLGRFSRTWPLDALPTLHELRVAARRIPVVFVTGTNGKTTTTRFVAAMVQAAGLVPGHTSSDGVVVDGKWVEEGDWTGPGAARLVLRHPAVDVALLETARGGLLRRGLAIGGGQVAALTNISADHLGEWGLDDLEAMAWAKLSVVHGLAEGATLVVNGSDPHLMRALGTLERTDLQLRYFADGPGAPDVEAWADEGVLWLRQLDGQPVELLAEQEVPLTLGGTVRFMVENALCAALIGQALGLTLEAIRGGLRSLQPDDQSSRGRLNRFQLPGGGQAIVDFAHNPAGVRGLAGFVEACRPGKLAVLCGQGGDRTEALLHGYADAIASLHPELVVLKELPRHRRGRPVGEVRSIMRARLGWHGIEGAAVIDVLEEVEAAAAALDATGEGDLALLLVHEELEGVLALLKARGAVRAG